MARITKKQKIQNRLAELAIELQAAEAAIDALKATQGSVTPMDLKPALRLLFEKRDLTFKLCRMA